MPETTTDTTRTTDQRRAAHAWAVVRAIDPKHAKKLRTHAKQLPTRIMASGLGQALAFLLAKDYAPDLLKAIGDWVLDKHRNPESTSEVPATNALLQRIVDGNSESLRRYTDETLAYLQWVNRFAEAELPSEGD